MKIVVVVWDYRLFGHVINPYVLVVEDFDFENVCENLDKIVSPEMKNIFVDSFGRGDFRIEPRDETHLLRWKNGFSNVAIGRVYFYDNL